ncbi:hypothetical protein [Paenibacillus polymyxa]|uniref:hypothetical protein n=1 Tax=Paenibacillus polymyxa TaxID=1406 RepID=UPI002AB3A249|nr:hypothetical protein [Paenibacillus polymyxa]MDY8026139.1 hypothetical protein [Paenibacillus polymyxa]
MEKCAEDLEQQKLIFGEKTKQREYFKAKKELKPFKEQLHKLDCTPNKRTHGILVFLFHPELL